MDQGITVVVKGSLWASNLQFSNFSMPRNRTDLSTIFVFWNVSTFLDDINEAPPNPRLLQHQREFLRYKLDILGLSNVRRWYTALRCCQ